MGVVESMPPGCPVQRVQGRGERDPVWVIFFENDAISVEVLWRKDDARCRSLTVSSMDAHCQAMGERYEEAETSLSRKQMTGWSTEQEVLGLWVNRKKMSAGLPQGKLKKKET